MDSILFWNKVALNAVKTDFSFPDPRPPELVPQQPGPTYTSRALAIASSGCREAWELIGQAACCTMAST